MPEENYKENDDRMNIIGQNGNDGLHYEGLNIDDVPYTEYNRRKLAQEVVGRLSKEELEEIVFAQQLEAFGDEDVFQVCWDFTYNGRKKDVEDMG